MCLDSHSQTILRDVANIESEAYVIIVLDEGKIKSAVRDQVVRFGVWAKAKLCGHIRSARYYSADRTATRKRKIRGPEYGAGFHVWNSLKDARKMLEDGTMYGTREPGARIAMVKVRGLKATGQQWNMGVSVWKQRKIIKILAPGKPGSRGRIREPQDYTVTV